MPPNGGSKFRRRRRLLLLAALVVAVLGLCIAPQRVSGPAMAEEPSSSARGVTTKAFRWQLPPGFPEPNVPTDNPMSDAKVELGRHLFYDARLSSTGDVSCATCHRQELAFTDGLPRAVGATGQLHRRSAMSLANVAYNRHLTWADPHLEQLEEQLLTPLFGHDPIEMGLQKDRTALRALADDPTLSRLFAAAFPNDPQAVNFINLGRALAAFQRTLLSGSSAFDRYWHQGQDDALDPAEKRGMRLFFSRRLACGECHRGFHLSGPVDYRGHRDRPQLHNTGLYNLAEGAYPASDQGLFEITGQADDMGRFRAPTLRNIAVTAPYMHDGSVTSLEEVIAHYAAGGRHILHGPLAGDGSQSPWKSDLLHGFVLTPEENGDLVAFLHSLTDPVFLKNPRFGPPQGATRP